MNIFVAGATGAIGRPLIAELVRQGHTVTGMTRSTDGARKLREWGATPALVSALDGPAVLEALHSSHAEVVIDQLTSLPKSHAEIVDAIPGDRKLRLEGGRNLLRAAEECRVRRYIQQSSGFFLKAGEGLADESVGMATNATPGVAMSARTYAELEERLLGNRSFEGVALRYGFFYGPGTWYVAEGSSAEAVRRREMSIIGAGDGVWSWVHIEDAASATAAVLTAPPGVYNIVDDDPSPLRVWLPAFAKSVGAPPPPRLAEDEALRTLGEDAVYYATKLRGASNAKAKRAFGFHPRRLEWLIA